MIEKISKLQAPALAGVVKEKKVAAAVAEIKNCIYGGASLIDLHLSCLEENDEESLCKIIHSSKIPVLALNYNKTYDNVEMGLSEEERVESLLRAVKAGAAGIDMQGYTLHAESRTSFCGEDKYSFTKENPKEVITDETLIAKQCELIEKVHSMGAEVLLSCHPDIPMTASQVVDLALFLEKRNPDVIKIVTNASNEEEMLESIKTMLWLKREIKTPVSYHAKNEFGTLSRILNPVLGSHMAFCIDRYNPSSLMEQLDLRTTRTIVDNMKKIL